jgi:putative aldouronate transport system substrate-binding protein
MGGPNTTGLGLHQTLITWGYDARGFFHGFGAYPGSWLDIDGVLSPGIVRPEVKNALDALRYMYAEGLLNREFATMNMDQLVADIVAGTVGMVYCEWWGFNWPLNNHILADPTADWGAVLIPSATGEPANTLINGNMVTVYNAISANAPPEAAEAAIKMLNLAWILDGGITPEEAYELYGEWSIPEGGYVYNWAPFFIADTTVFTKNFYLLQDAIAKNDFSGLYTAPQQELVISYQVLFEGLEHEDFPYSRAWGLWNSRGGDGWALTMEVRDRELYVVNEFFGMPTPTQVSRGSTLNDMWVEFSARYIMGALAESEWDVFVNNWLTLGGADWSREADEQWQGLRNR